MKRESKSSFFQQSGWMVIATFFGGIFMTLVHTIARKMGSVDYSAFVTLLRLLIILAVPSVALQTVFAQQAAAAIDETRECQLRAATRAVLTWTFLIWLAVAAATLAGLPAISRFLKVSNSLALCFTLGMALTSLWTPIIKGLLQGRHQFGGLGWLAIVDGVGRFGITLAALQFLHGKAASAMGAAFLGQVVALAMGAWLSRDIWSRRPQILFDRQGWLTGAGPLTIGLGTVLLMSSIDMPFVQSLFFDNGQTALYGGAMLTGFAIVQFIAPVAMVMFPRIVRASARSEGGEGMKWTLTATALFGLCAALGCTFLPKLPLRVIYSQNPEMLQAAPLVRWFGWALLPLTAANVLVQNVLARGRFDAALWLAMAPVGYAAALCIQAPHLVMMKEFDAFIRVIQTLGIFCLVLCGMAAWFCRPVKAPAAAGQDWAPARAASDKSSSPAA